MAPAAAGAAATEELFYTARTGDVARALYLLEVAGAEANAHDVWQATPLFYSSRCGHVEMVRVLLRAGAKCERRTYDGERILYAALNDATRCVLLEEGFAFAGARSHDPYLEHLENMFDNVELHAPWRDVAFVLHGERLEAHRCVLVARCPYLAERFLASSGCGDGGGACVVQLPGARFPVAALAALLRWCYTGRLAVAAAAADATAALLRQVKLRALADALRAEAAAAPPKQQSLALEPSRADAKAALAQLADAASDADATAAGLAPQRADALRAGAAALRVDGVFFWAHAGFLCPRSDFFAALLGARWRGGDDASAAAAPPPLQLHDTSAHAFRLALRWAYTDVVDAATPLPLLLELLECGDRMLLEGLKQRCALLLVPHVAPDTAVPLLRLAESAATPRLGAAAAAAVAEHLEDLADCAELAQAVAESAASIRGRQLTDSIPVLDDVAFQVRRLHGEGGDLSEDDEPPAWDDVALPPEARAAAAAAARHSAVSVRRRKAAIVRQLAAAVQGWGAIAVRRDG